MSDRDDTPREDGFEYEGVFYRWHVSDVGKDLMLIDRIAGMPVTEFFETIEDEIDRERAPVLLALIATSMRFRHPERSLERIHRTVMNLALSDVVFVDADEKEIDEQRPPTDVDETQPPSDVRSISPSDASSLSSTPADNTNSQTSSAIPA